MSEVNMKSVESENIEKMNEMILKFRQCADTTSDLSNSVEKFTDIYLNIEKNVTALKGVEGSLNSNKYIKELFVVTDNMKDIFNYFSENIPQFSKSLLSSKRELDLHKDELSVVLDYFVGLTYKIDNVIEKIKLSLNEHFIENKNIIYELQGYVEDENKRTENNYKGKKKTILEEIKKQLDTGLIGFQKETLKLINDSVNKIIDEKIELLVNNFDDMSNNLVESINGYNNSGKTDTIYNLYSENGRNLPIDVKRISWTEDFHFKVDKIDKSISEESFSLMAYGKRFIGNSYYDTVKISADLKQFKLVNSLDFIPIEDEGDIPF